MWNDEDNNPYGASFDPNAGQQSLLAASAADYGGYDVLQAQELRTGDLAQEHEPFDGTVTAQAESDDEPETIDRVEAPPRRKSGGYDSRIEQMLYENPELRIVITDATKSLEGNGRYTVYIIQTGKIEVRRRYSEFSSLREALTRLHPTLIIPPIPEKHTMADYAANPTNAKQDQQIIELRKRMLEVFLNRCRGMELVRTDGVWWKFLDPNASWSEVINSPPISNIPRLILKAPPLDMANPTTGHQFLPIPPANARLRAHGGTNTSGASNDGAVGFARFPADGRKLSEQELDRYFGSYESSIKELETLLVGSIEKVNRRTLNHLTGLAADLCELGSRFNALALSEQAPYLGLGIERIGQAADSSYLRTGELARLLGASFAEPMRENAQFAGVVRGVVRYRVLKRVQQEMTTDELYKRKMHLEQLERSETEARRIDQYVNSSQFLASGSGMRHGEDAADGEAAIGQTDGIQEDTASIDSDFPHAYGDFPSSQPGVPDRGSGGGSIGGNGSGNGNGNGSGHGSGLGLAPGPAAQQRKLSTSNSLTNKIFGPLRHAVQGVVDADPERSRRDLIGRTREAIGNLEQAKVVSERDVRDASVSILADLLRFQLDKEADLRRCMLAYAKSFVEWSKKCQETWEEARAEVSKIEET